MIDPDDPRFETVVVPIGGDIRAPGLAMDVSAAELLRREVTTVIHCAANTSFLASADCWETNVAGTRNLLNFTNQLSNLVQFIYVGSAASTISSPDCEVNEELSARAPSHFVEYTRTKQAAEDAIAAHKGAFRKIIVRPSYVIPDELLTVPTIRQSIWPLSIMARCAMLPINPETRLDVVRLSVVGEYVAKFVQKPPEHLLYYLTGGAAHSPIWRDVIDVVVRSSSPGSAVELVRQADWSSRGDEVTPQLARRLQRVAMFFPFINRNVTFSSARLFSEYGRPDAARMDVLSILPMLLKQLSLEAALEQSLAG